jgi:predicted ATP-dependent endonuclease of OLD family
MRIAHLEITNFRKLLSARIDLNDATTLFVGANNSGKTSAVIALRYFLGATAPFALNDFTLSQWGKIRALGEIWRASKEESSVASVTEQDWVEVCPALDLWLDVGPTEFHHVAKLIPNLDWSGGLLGVRLRYEPNDVGKLRDDFITNLKRVAEVKESAKGSESASTAGLASLWPIDLVDFLKRQPRLHRHFVVRAYLLDPTKLAEPTGGAANPQTLPVAFPPANIENVRSLMRVDEIEAQRGFGQSSGESDESGSRGRSRLSMQLRQYFSKHLDPTDTPDVTDLAALKAIEEAQRAFDQRLEHYFKSAMDEVQALGYPGVTDPKIALSTRLHPVDGLNHQAAVQYRVDSNTQESLDLHLPEDFNGLGYQNLISMIFRLMSFRDGWMRVGKADAQSATKARPPLHLVLIEEPEAHLHAQVQQVFANKAYKILREHPLLKSSTVFTTQLIISTHSIHIAHELDFACLRYFRRLPAGKAAEVPISSVINLKDAFGPDNETKRFVTRYLKAQHCDLFFADAAIMVEGPAERMLIPHFIRRQFDFLNHCYITLLEVGGSHAHRFRPLIETLGLITIVVTDIDAQGKKNAEPVRRGAHQTTNNDTLRTWVPKIEAIDELLDLPSEEKICSDDGHLFAVRAAYQKPVMNLIASGDAASEALPYTFEDSLVFENMAFFEHLQGKGLIAKFREALKQPPDIQALSTALFEALQSGSKAEFVLELILSAEFETLNAPNYIEEALFWLEERLRKKLSELIPSPVTQSMAPSAT